MCVRERERECVCVCVCVCWHRKVQAEVVLVALELNRFVTVNTIHLFYRLI